MALHSTRCGSSLNHSKTVRSHATQQKGKFPSEEDKVSVICIFHSKQAFWINSAEDQMLFVHRSYSQVFCIMSSKKESIKNLSIPILFIILSNHSSLLSFLSKPPCFINLFFFKLSAMFSLSLCFHAIVSNVINPPTRRSNFHYLLTLLQARIP